MEYEKTYMKENKLTTICFSEARQILKSSIQTLHQLHSLPLM